MTDPRGGHRPNPFREHPEAFPSVLIARGICTRVLDGDSYEVMVDVGLHMIRTEILRLRGLDTPEIRKPASEEEIARGLEAKARAEALILERPVMLEIYPREQTYGRFVADVKWWDGEGWRDVADTLRAEGWAK